MFLQQFLSTGKLSILYRLSEYVRLSRFSQAISPFSVFTRGSSEDYDRFASVSGDSGWSWSNMLPYFKKLEKWTLPADNHNITGQYNPSVHGYDGILNVSLAGFPAPTDGRVLATIEELGQEFTYNVDVNSGNSLGMGAHIAELFYLC